MKVSLASQVISHSVVSGMNTHMTLGALPKDAEETIHTLEKFNNLFDICNSFAMRPTNKYKKVFEGSNFQIAFLNEALDFLNKLKIYSSNGKEITNRIKFKKCWIITITAMLKLWEKLSKVGFKYLKTRRLNTDCLENFFGCIRQQSGNNVNPTPIQFQRAFRKLFCQNYFHSNHMNCMADLDQILIDTETSSDKTTVSDVQSVSGALDLPDYDYRKDNALYKNAFNYVCGYIIKKTTMIHKCDICISFQEKCRVLDVNNLLISFKAFNTTKSPFGSLQCPSEIFILFIFNLENIFCAKFEEICGTRGVSKRLFDIMKNVEFEHPCPQFPKIYVIKLFIRLKIYYTLKYTNRDLRISGKDRRAVRKLKILSHL